MVIFGAGASYDSAPSYAPGSQDTIVLTEKQLSYRPPLADELFEKRDYFEEIMQRFSACLGVIDILRTRTKGVSVERALQELEAKSRKDDEGSSEILAIRFYLQRMIWECESRWKQLHNGVTNYRTLLYLIRQYKEKQGQPVCFVTFNYDRMLEDAISTLDARNVRIATINDYINSDRYKIFKVHGSVNWGIVIHPKVPVFAPTVTQLALTEPLANEKEEKINRVISLAHLILEPGSLTNEYQVIESLPPFTSAGFPLVPAVAIPLESKQDFLCPANHLRELTSYIPQITKLLIIGWRATDAPFLELLRAAPRDMHVHIVCGGDEAEGSTVAANMEKAGINAQAYFTKRYLGFTDFVRSGKAEKFLSD